MWKRGNVRMRENTPMTSIQRMAIMAATTGLLTPILLISGCTRSGGGADGEPETTQPTAEQVRQCERVMHVTFPAAGKVEGLHVRSENGTVVSVKASMTLDELHTFIENSPFRETALSSTERRVTNDLDTATWWEPDAAKAFESGEVEIPVPAATLRILIGKDDAQRATVYLHWRRK